MTGRPVLAALLGAGLLLEVAVTVSAHPPLPAGLVTLAATAGACAAALFRRARPAVAAAVAAGLVLALELVDAGPAPAVDANGPPPVACLAMLIATGSAVRRLRLGGAVLAAAGGLLPALAARSLYSPTVALVMLCGAVAAAGVGGWLRAGDARRRSTRESVRRAERDALARDLHDVAAHHLTALIIQAQAGQVGPGDPRAALAGIETAGVEALDSLRRVVRLLRDEEAATGDVPGTVAELVAAFARRGEHDAVADPGPGVTVRLEAPDGPQPADWPPEVATAVYRITQEALTNVARHAHAARHVTVTLAHDAHAVRLTVTDDGRPAGEDAGPADAGAPRAGHGIAGMRERAAALGGTLAVRCGERGWTVRADIPMAAAPAPAPRRWRR